MDLAHGVFICCGWRDVRTAAVLTLEAPGGRREGQGELNPCHTAAYPLPSSPGTQSGRAVDVPVYDFCSHSRSTTEKKRTEPADVIILEGILVLHMERIRNLLNMKIFVDTDDDVRLARRCSPPPSLPFCPYRRCCHWSQPASAGK